MYQVKCDKYFLYDYRDPSLILENPQVNVEVNTIGEGSFTIYDNHPNYSKLKKLKSVFEVRDEIGVIFRGRMTNDSVDFDNVKEVDLEGIMGYFNDSIVRPYAFPDDFLEDAEYITASESGNVVKFLLNWFIENHNSQVQDFQKFKLGEVTVSDPNNYITRSNTKHSKTWDELKSKLFESGLGGYLCIRYEDDGNYIDYLEKFTLTNTQGIEFGSNLLDLKNDSDASNIFTAIIPIGAEIETETTDDNGETVTTKSRVTIEGLADGEITDDIVKDGDTIYSKSAVEEYGWIYANTDETTWDDVTTPENLQTKAVTTLQQEGVMMSEVVEYSAADLHCTDEEIRSFRIYRNVNVNSAPHNQKGVFPLTKLQIPLLKPQDTKITVGGKKKTFTDKNYDRYQNADIKIESAKNDLMNHVSLVQKDLNKKIEGIDGSFFYIRYSEFEDGHVMSDVPDANTQYMGTCSTNESTAPSDFRKYTWCKIRGENGADGEKGSPGESGSDGRTSYLHVKYSNDGVTFTENQGETIGTWIGTLVDFTETDSTTFSDYTWKRFVGSDGKDGANGKDGKDGVNGTGISNSVVYYYLSTSNTAQSGGSWVTTPPSWVDGKYYWQKIVTTYTDGTTKESTPVCITGAKGTTGSPGSPGSNGADGVGVSSISTEFYLSTSKTTQSGDSWGTTMPTWSSGRYLWSRSKITYTNGTTAYTTPICDSSWEAVNELQIGGRNFILNSDNFTSAGNSNTGITPSVINGIWKIVTTSGNGNWHSWSKSNVIEDNFKTGDEFTFSIEIRCDSGSTGKPNIYFKSGMGYYSLQGTISTEYSTLYYTGKWIDTNNIQFHFGWSGTVGTFYIRRMKFERGNKATDWSQAPEDVDKAILDSADEVRETILEQSTNITNDCEQIILEALSNYTETEDFDSFKQTVESQLKVVDDKISIDITNKLQEVVNNNGDLQSQITEVQSYFEFTNDKGLLIGKVVDGEENPYQVQIKNNEINILNNGNIVQSFDAEGNALIPKLRVTEQFELLGYTFTIENGVVSCG